MKFLVDANVLSEPTRPSPNQAVVQWLHRHESDLAVNPIVLGELEYGILMLPPSRRRRRLEDWFVSGALRIHVLEMGSKTATEWARLLSRLKKKGRAMPIKDSLIAASAIEYRLSVATRNVDDFQYSSVKIVNPFTAKKDC